MNNDNRNLLIVIITVCLLGLVLLIAPIVLLVHAIARGGHSPFLGTYPVQGAHFTRSSGTVAIPTGTNAFCETNLCDERLCFFQRTMVEAYRKVGRHNPAWDEGAVNYLEASSRASASMPDAQTPEALARAGKAVLDAGCTDPMVEYNYGLDLLRSDAPEAAKSYLQQAIDGFKSCRYPRARARLAAARLAELERDISARTYLGPHPQLGQEQNAVKSLALQWLSDSLRDGSYTKSEQRLFLDQLSDQVDKVFTAREVLDQLQTVPDADPYCRQVIEGWQEMDAAWKARGDGWANEVTAAGWKGFEQHLTCARQKFTAAWQQHPELPEAPSAMIQVAMAGHANPGETVYTWFNRAVSAQMDYQPAYQYLLFALRPRWCGSYAEMYRVGLSCLATNRYDTTVPTGFFKAVHMISEDDNGNLDYWQRPETYRHLQTMFDSYLRTAPPEQHNKYLSQYAAAAFLCGHYADAKRMLTELGHQVDEEPFRLYAHCSAVTARMSIEMNQPPDLHHPVPQQPLPSQRTRLDALRQ